MFSMSSVWDRATEFVGDNLSAILPFALVIIATATVQEITNQAVEGTAPMAMLAASCVLIIVSLFSVVARLAVIALAVDDNRSAGEAAALAIGRLFAVLLLIVLLFAILGLLTVPMIVALIAGGVDPQQLRSLNADTIAALPMSVTLFELIYSLVLCVVLLWIGARLALLFPVMLVERRLFGALGRSFRLTRGYALRILGVLLLIGIVGGVAAMAARTVFGSVLRLALGGETAFSIASVITAIVVAAVATVFTVIGDAFTGKLYAAARAAEHDTAAA